MYRKIALLLVLLSVLPTFAFQKGPQGPQIPSQNPHYTAARAGDVWCPTDLTWTEKRRALGLSGFNKAGCPTEGACDFPANRDATQVSGMNVDVIVHVMRDNNGSGGVSQSTVDATIGQMNADYAQAGITFNLVDTQYHNNSSYNCIAAYSYSGQWANDIAGMKSQYNVQPDRYLNIYISCQDQGFLGTLLGIATFPWDPDALTAQGGLWLNSIAVGTGVHTASHEIGHCLGLWHTHHGVSEVNSCDSCYEFASGVEGDVRGDFASDTPPTPVNYNCSDPGGSDCQGTSWGNTQTENIMGYGPDSCMDYFSPQQIRRMHCWTNDVLNGWLGGSTGGNQSPTADFSTSTNGLTANFDASASSDADGSVVAYAWNFGDGTNGSGVSPSHAYAASGTYTVTLTVTDNEGATDSFTQSVTVSDGSAALNLSATGYKVKGRHSVDLTWSGASGSSVEIYRDGQLIATTANDGAYTDSTNNRGGAVYTYEVCEVGGGCSNEATVIF